MPPGTFPRKEPAQESPRGTKSCQIPAAILDPQVPPQASQGLHCRSVSSNSEWSLVPRPPEPPRRLTKTLAPHEELFRQASDGARDKASFVRAVQNFGQYSVHKRGHVDFIYLALRKMREYGVERDLAVYNLLLDIFPKEVFRPRNFFQSVFIHYPRQQECGIAVLEQMENHGEASRLWAVDQAASLSVVSAPPSFHGSDSPVCPVWFVCSPSCLSVSSLSSLPLTFP